MDSRGVDDVAAPPQTSQTTRCQMFTAHEMIGLSRLDIVHVYFDRDFMCLALSGGFVVEARIKAGGQFADGAVLSRHPPYSGAPAPWTKLAISRLTAIVHAHRARVASAMRVEATQLLKQVDRRVQSELAVPDSVRFAMTTWGIAEVAVALRAGAHRLRPARPVLTQSPILQRTLPPAYEERARMVAENAARLGYSVTPPRDLLLRFPLSYLDSYQFIRDFRVLSDLAGLRRDQLSKSPDVEDAADCGQIRSGHTAPGTLDFRDANGGQQGVARPHGAPLAGNS